MRKLLALLLFLAAPAAGQVVYLPDSGGGGSSFTTSVCAPLGSEAAPSYSFCTRTNDGVYSYGAGYLGLTTGGTAKWVVGGTEEIVRSDMSRTWSSTTNLSAGRDIGLARSAAGLLKVTDGGAGSGRLLVGQGSAASPAVATAFNANGTGMYFVNDTVLFSINTTPHVAFGYNTSGVSVTTNGTFGWSSTSSAVGALDTGLGRIAAGAVGVTQGGTVSTTSTVILDSTNTSIKFSAGTCCGDVGIARAGGGGLRISDAGSAMGWMRSLLNVTPNTTTLALALVHSGMFITNTGDADGSIAQLPNDPVAGTYFDFAVVVAFALDITPGAGESIRDAGSSGTTKITSNTVGSTLRLVAVTSGNGAVWMVVAKIGTWTVS